MHATDCAWLRKECVSVHLLVSCTQIPFYNYIQCLCLTTCMLCCACICVFVVFVFVSTLLSSIVSDMCVFNSIELPRTTFLSRTIENVFSYSVFTLCINGKFHLRMKRGINIINSSWLNIKLNWYKVQKKKPNFFKVVWKVCIENIYLLHLSYKITVSLGFFQHDKATIQHSFYA